MVAYCDVNCQKEHRQEHKDDCRSVISDDGVRIARQII